MKKLHKDILKAILLLFPLALGTIGLFSAGETLINALFNSITMYGMNYGDEPANWMIQTARWLAPVATVSGIALMFASVARYWHALLIYLNRNSVAVYGDDELAESIRSQCGYPVVVGKDKVLPAHKYVLFWEEGKNLDFYLAHQKELAKKQVYMRCNALYSQLSGSSGLHLFSAEETGARLYWKQAGMYSLTSADRKDLRIILIGFGRLGEELLKWGLQNNIFYPDQKISYDIYGDAKAFVATHQGLHSISDTIAVHETPWYENTEKLRTADKIIVCEQQNQIDLVQKLLFTIPESKMDVLAERSELFQLIDERNRLSVFCWREEAMKPQNIFDELTLERAKAINLRYAHIYYSVEETSENAENEWEKLDAFTRYSNISAADYHEIRLQMLQHWKEDRLSDEHLELLSELEHIRWCRFHYLNNWQYGEPEDGKKKNADKRLHQDLIDYADLDEAAKEKDRENIRVMMNIH